MSDRKCDGACRIHVGDVVKVRVKDLIDGRDWGEFFYCDAAAEEDRKSGFDVEVIDNED